MVYLLFLSAIFAFEQSFLLANRGSKDWWSQKHHVNLDGWQANEAASNIFHVLSILLSDS